MRMVVFVWVCIGAGPGSALQWSVAWLLLGVKETPTWKWWFLCRCVSGRDLEVHYSGLWCGCCSGYRRHLHENGSFCVGVYRGGNWKCPTVVCGGVAALGNGDTYVKMAVFV